MKISVKNSDFGHGVFADARANPGDMIFREKTRMFSTEPDVCEQCFCIIESSGGPAAIKCVICSRSFCSLKCKKAGKNNHNISCSRLKLTPRQQLLYKLYCIGSKKFCEQKSKIIPPEYNFIGKNDKISEEDWLYYARVVSANAFRVKTCVLSESIGYAIYEIASKINHSCAPNCIYFFVGAEIVIKCIRAIEPGDEITISYIPLQYTIADATSRYNYILKRFGFECRCELCLSGSALSLSGKQPDSSETLITDSADFTDLVNCVSDIRNRHLPDIEQKCRDVIARVGEDNITMSGLLIEAIVPLLISFSKDNSDIPRLAESVMKLHFGGDYLQYLTTKELMLISAVRKK